MDFLKKHYEKVVLSVVLLAVAVAAFLLLIEVNRVKESLEASLTQRTTKKGAGLPPLDLSTNELALKRVLQTQRIQLDGEHNTFNPGTWDKGPDGLRRRNSKGGLGGLTVKNLNPLNLVVTFTGVAGVADAPRYQFSVSREFEKTPAKRRPVVSSLSVGTKNDALLLREVKGPKEDPTELVCELSETGERFVLTKEKDFRKPYGYAVDLRHENKDFPGKRVDDSISLAGVTYKIVAIGKDELVVSAPNQVRTTIPAVSAP
jgi:hypothetical protein